MANILRPRRGKKSTAEAQNLVLKKGEVLFEVPETGVGKGIGKIKMGDGIANYSDLPYFLEGNNIFTDSCTIDKVSAFMDGVYKFIYDTLKLSGKNQCLCYVRFNYNDGSSNSAIIIGQAHSSFNRGRFIVMPRTNSDVFTIRLSDNNGLFYTKITSAESEYIPNDF